VYTAATIKLLLLLLLHSSFLSLHFLFLPPHPHPHSLLVPVTYINHNSAQEWNFGRDAPSGDRQTDRQKERKKEAGARRKTIEDIHARANQPTMSSVAEQREQWTYRLCSVIRARHSAFHFRA